MTANTPASRKAKGRRLQQAVRQDLIDRLGIDPGDILSTAMGSPVATSTSRRRPEPSSPSASSAKRRNGFALPAWWKQCTRNAAAEGSPPSSS